MSLFRTWVWRREEWSNSYSQWWMMMMTTLLKVIQHGQGSMLRARESDGYLVKSMASTLSRLIESCAEEETKVRTFWDLMLRLNPWADVLGCR